MRDYRCYPTSYSGSIAGVGHEFVCVDDASAIDKAYAIFSDQPFEVWQGMRKVYAKKGVATEFAV